MLKMSPKARKFHRKSRVLTRRNRIDCNAINVCASRSKKVTAIRQVNDITCARSIKIFINLQNAKSKNAMEPKIRILIPEIYDEIEAD